MNLEKVWKNGQCHTLLVDLENAMIFLRIIKQFVIFPSKVFVFFNSTILPLEIYTKKVLQGYSSQLSWKQLSSIVDWLKID